MDCRKSDKVAKASNNDGDCVEFSRTCRCRKAAVNRVVQEGLVGWETKVTEASRFTVSVVRLEDKWNFEGLWGGKGETGEGRSAYCSFFLGKFRLGDTVFLGEFHRGT